MAATMQRETEGAVALVGTAENPAHDPRKAPREGRGSIGDQAFMTAVMIVVGAWVLLLALAYSLRHHNI